MWLGLDAGNSNVVVGVFGPSRLQTYRLSTYPLGTADELKARVRQLVGETHGTTRGETDEAPGDCEIVLSSVVPAFTRIARQAFAKLRVIDSSWPFSFEIGTTEPHQTGIDRLVNAEAATREGKAPAILIDSGTTTTICALERGLFRGGAILPGLESGRDILATRAAQLHGVDLVPPTRAIGPSTDEALRSGLVLGYASMIEGMIARFKAEFTGPTPRVIATGGASRLLRELCPSIDELDPELTLRGIAYLRQSRRS